VIECETFCKIRLYHRERGLKLTQIAHEALSDTLSNRCKECRHPPSMSCHELERKRVTAPARRISPHSRRKALQLPQMVKRK